MEKLQLRTTFVDTFRVIGISLPSKTENQNNRSAVDCGSLWQKFHSGNYSSVIPGKVDNDIIAVYYDYEGDHLAPFSYLIGHRVAENTSPTPELNYVDISAGKYLKVTAQGNIHECMKDAWQDVWQSDLKRTYKYDFEIYIQDRMKGEYAEVDILVGIR